MASVTSCSLHPMDVGLLRQLISAMQGGPIPDFKIEVARRAHLDLLMNLSHKVVTAAAPLESSIPQDKWQLFTKMRPFFITAEAPDQAAALVDRFLTVDSLADMINLFREEVARLDADRADDIIAVAQQDKSSDLIQHFEPEEITANLRIYLFYQRRQLESLSLASAEGSLPKKLLAKSARLLAWRTCYLLAYLQPSWTTGSTSFTSLAQTESGFLPLMADPRGIFASLTEKISGLHALIPYNLSGDTQTGMCVTPRSVTSVLAEMSMSATPNTAEMQAVQEALIYARQRETGVWEAARMVIPEEGIFPRIMPDQGERDEQLINVEPAQPATVNVPVSNGPIQQRETTEVETAAVSEDFAQKWEKTTPINSAAPKVSTEVDGQKAPWYKTLFQAKKAGEPKPAKEKAPKQPKQVKAPKPAKEPKQPKPEKPAKEPKQPKPAKAPKPAKEPKPPKPPKAPKPDAEAKEKNPLPFSGLFQKKK